MKKLTTEERSKLGTRQFYGENGHNPIDDDILLVAKINKNMIPGGALTEISKRHNVTRERVRQRVKSLHLIPPRETAHIIKSIPCKNCGKPNFNRKFCDVKCSQEYRFKTKKELRKCKVCKKEFESYRYHKKRFCSKKCKGIAQRKYAILDMSSFTYEDIFKFYPSISRGVADIVVKRWLKENLVRKEYEIQGSRHIIRLYKI